MKGRTVVEVMLTQTAHRFSVQDFYRMAETGVLRPDARVELLDGQIIDLSPIGPLHGSVVKRLIRHFQSSAGRRWTLSVQDPLHLDDHSEPQPDLMLLLPVSDDYASGHPRPDDVYLLVEVADGTVDFDREEKLPLYARAGVPEVWIVNLAEEQVEVYREPSFGRYSAITIISKEEAVAPAAFPDMQIQVGALLRR